MSAGDVNRQLFAKMFDIKKHHEVIISQLCVYSLLRGARVAKKSEFKSF